MNLIAARGILPISNRMDRSPELAYLPKPLRLRWWRPRVTLTELLSSRVGAQDKAASKSTD